MARTQIHIVIDGDSNVSVDKPQTPEPEAPIIKNGSGRMLLDLLKSWLVATEHSPAAIGPCQVLPMGARLAPSEVDLKTIAAVGRFLETYLQAEGKDQMLDSSSGPISLQEMLAQKAAEEPGP